jgi:hypothetical protein
LPLFSRGQPNEAVLFSFLEGKYPGQLFVDRHDKPGMAFAATAFGWGFFSEGSDADFIAACRARCPSHLICGTGAPASGSQVFERLEYREPLAQPAEPEIPAGFELRVIDDRILQQCVWRGVVLAAAGSEAAFLQHGLGLVLTSGDSIACEVYGLFRTQGLIEIGGITNEGRQNRGLCTALSRELINRCHALGCATTWTCDLDNPPSQAVAKKLGYQAVRSYRFYL